MKKSTLLYIVAAAVVIIAIACFLFGGSFKYEILDEVHGDTEGGNITFLFVGVSKLDSTEIRSLAKELFKEKIIDKYKDAKVPSDANHEYTPPAALIAYFYKQNDTTAIPEQMKAMLSQKFRSSHALQGNLDYISEGFIYSGAYQIADKKQTVDSLSSKTMLLVPKKGVKAKDVLKQAPNSHDGMEGMPEGHPPVDMESLPPGHPPIDMPGMPEGHPTTKKKETAS